MNEKRFTFEGFLEEFPELVQKVDEIYSKISKQKSPEIMQEQQVRTIEEAAKYLKMSVPTLRIYLKQGHITGSRLGKRWLFQQKDLKNFLDRFLVASPQDLLAIRGF